MWTHYRYDLPVLLIRFVLCNAVEVTLMNIPNVTDTLSFPLITSLPWNPCRRYEDSVLKMTGRQRFPIPSPWSKENTSGSYSQF